MTWQLSSPRTNDLLSHKILCMWQIYVVFVQVFTQFFKCSQVNWSLIRLIIFVSLSRIFFISVPKVSDTSNSPGGKKGVVNSLEFSLLWKWTISGNNAQIIDRAPSVSCQHISSKMYLLFPIWRQNSKCILAFACLGQHFIAEKFSQISPQFTSYKCYHMTFVVEICWSISLDKRLFFGLLYKVSLASCDVINYINLSNFESETFLVSHIMSYPDILLSLNLYTKIVRFFPTVGFFSFFSQKVLPLDNCLSKRWLFLNKFFTLGFQRPFEIICSLTVIWVSFQFFWSHRYTYKLWFFITFRIT